MEPCKFCKAPVIWGTTRKGKRMPLDASPSTNGEFSLSEEERGEKQIRFVHEGDRPSQKVYTSHFKTCTNQKRDDPF